MLASPLGLRLTDGDAKLQSLPPQKPPFDRMPTDDAQRHQRLPSLSTILSSPTSDEPRYQYQSVQSSAEPRFARRYVGFEPGHRQPPHPAYATPAPNPSLNYSSPPAHTIPSASESRPTTSAYVYQHSSPVTHTLHRQGPLPALSSSSPHLIPAAGLPPTSTSSPATSVIPGGSDAQNQPKLVGIRDFDGYGQCYVYDDGKFIQCSIAGERVNPDWGVTKAGKPRKRLAQACMACREKKIRCPYKPGQIKCDHCAKANRTCERAPAHRSSPDPSTPEGSSSEFLLGGGPRRSPYSAIDPRPFMTRKRSADLYPPPSTSVPREMSPAFSVAVGDDGALKRRKSQASSLNDKSQGSQASLQSILQPEPMPIDTAGLDCRMEPFNGDPVILGRLLNLYYKHRGWAPYHVIPAEYFIDWAINCKTKTTEQRMLLYVMLAIGARFSTVKQEKDQISTKLAKAAEQGCSMLQGRASHLLAHTRLYLCLWYFSKGENETAWEYHTAAYANITALNYNTEEGVNEIDEDDLGLFDLKRSQVVECRRRTFWTCYAIDRYIGYAAGHIANIADEDILLRLPQHASDFLDCKPSDAPYFTDLLSADFDPKKLSDMALLVFAVNIWGDATAYMYRTRYAHTSDGYVEEYDKTQKRIEEKLEKYRSLLPVHLRCNPRNTREAIDHGHFGFYWILNCIIMVSSIKMHRFGRRDLLPTTTIKTNVRKARDEAQAIMTMVTSLALATAHEPYNDDLEYALSQPFTGYAIMAACDVISVAGPDHGSRERATRHLGDARDVVESLARYWTTADFQKRKIHQRLVKMSAMCMHDDHGRWLNEIPLDIGFVGPENDLIYGVPEQILHEALSP